jgi:hypothetical protein
VSEALKHLKGVIGPGWPGMAEAILGRHAHELAAKQREASIFDFANPCACDMDRCEACEVRRTIDLIDPEVSK